MVFSSLARDYIWVSMANLGKLDIEYYFNNLRDIPIWDETFR
jgi:hypothetical protein